MGRVRCFSPSGLSFPLAVRAIGYLNLSPTCSAPYAEPDHTSVRQAPSRWPENVSRGEVFSHGVGDASAAELTASGCIRGAGQTGELPQLASQMAIFSPKARRMIELAVAGLPDNFHREQWFAWSPRYCCKPPLLPARLQAALMAPATPLTPPPALAQNTA